LFHLALLFVLLAVGSGSALGAKGTVLVREGSGFANNITQYDTFTPGRAFDTSLMAPFSFKLKNFFASYQLGGMQNGAPREFYADVEVKNTPDSKARKVRIAVNEPLRVEGSSVYLVGHGYAPEITVKDRQGNVVWKDAAIFLPQDGNFTSTGVVKAPDTVPQLGLQAFFLPTAAVDMTQGPHSTFPAPTDPMVFMSVWSGDLGLDSGVPQSVYRLDTTKMKKIGLERLKPGETYVLPDGEGSVTFDGYKEWASFSITRDPGKGWALGAGMCAIVGLSLSLLVPRRRAWLRITPIENGASLVEVAGLSKTEAPGLVAEISALASTARKFVPEVLHGDQ
jgi:cytochrome c biogenesis protein